MTLDIVLEEGRLVNRNWLREKGFSNPDVDYFMRSGKLVTVARGIYRKPGPPLKWQNIVYSLTTLGFLVHIGHYSALKYHGYEHYLELGGDIEITVYCGKQLPAWINNFEQFRFKQVKYSPFYDAEDTGLIEVPFGTWDWPIQYSTPERAFMELLSTIRTKNELEKAMLMFESAVNLRPMVIQKLLESAKQVKASRLFLWMSREHNFDWYKSLDKEKIDLGHGKRQIIKDGVLDKEFMITVPKENPFGTNESIF